MVNALTAEEAWSNSQSMLSVYGIESMIKITPTWYTDCMKTAPGAKNHYENFEWYPYLPVYLFVYLQSFEAWRRILIKSRPDYAERERNDIRRKERICSMHFRPRDFYGPARTRSNMRRSAVPSVNLWQRKPSGKNQQRRIFNEAPIDAMLRYACVST